MIADWRSYTISDFLPFSADAYWRLFALENQALWPLHIAVLGAVALPVVALSRTSHRATGLLTMLLGAIWLQVGWRFVQLRYGSLNWAADWLAGLFYAEAALLLIAGLACAIARPTAGGGAGTAPGLVVFAAALVLHPLLAVLDGRSWQEAEVFAIAPDPTALVTLGWLALIRRRRRSALLLAAPVLWLSISTVTLLAMGAWQGWVTGAACGAGILAWIWSGGRRLRTAP